MFSVYGGLITHAGHGRFPHLVLARTQGTEDTGIINRALRASASPGGLHPSYVFFLLTTSLRGNCSLFTQGDDVLQDDMYTASGRRDRRSEDEGPSPEASC